jgi:transcriptional regulator with XRE-family HTH domain
VSDDALSKRFSENLAKALGASGLSQEALASRAEIHRSVVSELLGARAIPKISTVVRLAGALGVQPAELMEGISFEPADRAGEYKIAPAKKKS